MMDSEDSARDLLERMLIDQNVEPTDLPLQLLTTITNNFSDDLVIGSGGFAVVYKGLLQNGTIAVKRLNQTLAVDEKKFRQEIDCLMSVRHKNIVRFMGFYSNTQWKKWKLNEKNVVAEEHQRFLCFEYLPWSLDKYIKDQSLGHEWKTCYQIIKGICKGLQYLHQQKIVHLDLKPANILLNHDMVPKIADFGLSKRFDKNQTHHMTSNLIGSQGYMAPEFFGGLITFKSDIYSLGIIIIEILTGNKGYADVDNVLKSWSIKFNTSPGDAQSSEHIRICTEIGIECTDFNPGKRPDTRRILEMLEEMESTFGVSEMADKAPYPLQGITSGVPMRSGLTSTEPNIMAANAAGDPRPFSAKVWRAWGLIRQKLSRVTTWQPSKPSWFKDPATASFQKRKHPTKEFSFSFAQLEESTMGFAPEAKIGESSFGRAYRGKLPDGRVVVIKRGARRDWGRRARRFQEVERVFWSEVALLSRLNHKNLVALVGYCDENEERLLVYEYMKNGPLRHHLHSQVLSPVVSSWKLRIKILLDASRCIEYLHLYAVPPIIHRNIKSSNILLDAGWTAHVTDLGLSITELDTEETVHMVRYAGTMAYMDPEYYGLSHLTSTSDVYSLGVVMLEVLTGKGAFFSDKEGKGGKLISLVNHAAPSIIAGNLGEVLDARVPEAAAHEAEAVELVAYTAVNCVRLVSEDRPTMADIVANLETAFRLLCEGDRRHEFGNSSSIASLSLSPWIRRER